MRRFFILAISFLLVANVTVQAQDAEEKRSGFLRLLDKD